MRAFIEDVGEFRAMLARWDCLVLRSFWRRLRFVSPVLRCAPRATGAEACGSMRAEEDGRGRTARTRAARPAQVRTRAVMPTRVRMRAGRRGTTTRVEVAVTIVHARGASARA